MTPKQRDILLIPIPFTDLQAVKRRPVLVLSNDNYNESTDDIVVAAITSNIEEKQFGVLIEASDVQEGLLKRTSLIRADKIYTLNQQIIVKRFRRLKQETYRNVVNAIRTLIE
ncbi:MAG: type II toxin-antitoxin system PemK/MazF family toxin [Ignavibacteriae bacterium]|nr:type II toxin-antitoxin system PemK/MazF family toxin [Ignavibacteriota bacterium]